MAQTFDDAARDAARELRLRIERDIADGRFLASEEDSDAAQQPDARAYVPRRSASRALRRGTGRVARHV